MLVNGRLVEYWSHYKIPLETTVVEEAVKSGQHVDNVVQSGNFTTSFVGSRKLLQNGPSIYTGIVARTADRRITNTYQAWI